MTSVLPASASSGSAIRRLSGAGSLRRSGSIRSNCSAGPRSRISAVQTRNAAATAPGLRAQARPPGTEFLDAETGRQKSSTNARTPTETKIQELSTRKSAQKRPIWRRVGNAWFARTGWWCAQSSETGLQANNREFLEISGQNRLPMSLWRWPRENLNVIPVGYTIIQAVSCYSAKQAVEAQEQAMRTAISDNCNLQTGDNARRSAHGAWRGGTPARLLR